MTDIAYQATLAKILSEGLSIGLVMIDRDCRIIYWNQWMALHSNRHAADTLGKHLLELFPEIQKRKKDRYLRRCMEGKVPVMLSSTLHGRLIDLDLVKGNERIQMMQTVKILPHLENGSVAGAIILIDDVTETLLHEKALRQLNAVLAAEKKQLEVTLHSIGDAVIATDIEGRVQLMNPVAENLTGWSRAEALGRPVQDIFHIINEQTRQRCVNPVQKVLESGQVVGLANHTALVSRGGIEYLIGDSGAPIRDESGQVIGVVLVFRDMTEKVKIENHMRQVQKMEAIGTLAGGIAHDFNNILGIILGNTELALDEVPDWNPARQNLMEVRTASFRARDVVKQILAFSRKAYTPREPVDMGEMVSESLKLMRSSIPTSIEIRQRIAPQTLMVKGDSGQLQQVLMNLCTNASHAMHEAGGCLEVILEPHEEAAKSAAAHPNLEPGAYVHLSVSDTGEGILPEIMDRIFEPYFTTKDVGEGSGLGLSVAQGIIDRHQGRIVCRSTPERGTTFDVYLMRLEEETAEKKSDAGRMPTGTERVLFVDDEEGIAVTCSAALKTLGYEVVSCTSPQAAWEMFKKSPDRFDIVVTDLTMPEMTGDRLAKKMIGIRSDLPVVLCTGYSDRVSKDQAARMGICRYVMKPVSKKTLAETVRKALDR